MSSTETSPAKTSKSSDTPVDTLSMGLLSQFTSLKDLEVQLEQITANQENLIQCMLSMNGSVMQSEEMMEVQLMVSENLKGLLVEIELRFKLKLREV